MSAQEEAPKRRPRSRGAGGRNRRRGGRGGEGAGQGGEAAPRRERPQFPVVPTEMVGTSQTGIVNSVIRKGRVRFGFILIGETSDPDALVPRVYFSFSNLADSEVIIRRGYIVTFDIKADDQDRSYADNIALTEEGKKIAAEREEKIAQRRAEEDAGERPPRRERRPRESKLVTLKVTCEGKPGEKEIEFDVNQSVGRMKSLATTEFDAPIEFNVYHVSNANPAGEFLTKAIMNGLEAGAKILLAPKREENA